MQAEGLLLTLLYKMENLIDKQIKQSLEKKEPIKVAHSFITDLIYRNEKDIEQVGRFVKSLDRLHSKDLAAKMQNLMIEEVLRLSEQNKQLKEYLEYDKK